MSDKEILDWINDHLECLRVNLKDEHEMTWIDATGNHIQTKGESIRNCVTKACSGDGYEILGTSPFSKALHLEKRQWMK